MSKRTVAKLAGFVGALGISAALIAAASGTTGAYFTDSKAGTMNGSVGQINLTAGTTDLNFANLMPGEYQTKKVTYDVDATGKVDVWLIFDDDQGFCDFTGAKDNPKCTDTNNDDIANEGGLGRFGHFAVTSNGHPKFTSYNLAHAPNGVTGQSCAVDPVAGTGGSDQKPTSRDEAIPYCGVPTKIKLASNLSTGAHGSVDVTFGLTGRATDQGGSLGEVKYNLVATQAGILPDAANF